MKPWLRLLFVILVVKPLVLLVLGMNARHRQRLPNHGPAILVANHNSHLDTMVLMSLFPLSVVTQVRPAAAADYFLRNRWLAWFALQVIGIIPLERQMAVGHVDPLAGCDEALARNEILILFPEGSRGEPEQMGLFHNGVAHLARRHPDVPIIPVFMHGLGRALPKGEFVLIPFFCDIFVGEALYWQGDRNLFMKKFQSIMESMARQVHRPVWEKPDRGG